jgi:hypothetical protein
MGLPRRIAGGGREIEFSDRVTSQSDTQQQTSAADITTEDAATDIAIASRATIPFTSFRRAFAGVSDAYLQLPQVQAKNQPTPTTDRALISSVTSMSSPPFPGGSPPVTSPARLHRQAESARNGAARGDDL